MSTITQQNAKQIRDPMQVICELVVASSSEIESYTVVNAYKSYDRTLGATEPKLRKIADLQNGGFPLDGSVQWWDPDVPVSDDNGRMGLRGNVGEPLTVRITGAGIIESVTIATEYVGTITVRGNTFTATGLDVVSINATSATITFTPADPTSRAVVQYIIAGAKFIANNDNLISCVVNLRNVSIDGDWQESDLELKMYYPNDISELLKYIDNGWPLTYRAGYSDEMSAPRKFYLNDKIEQIGNIITIKAVDASARLDDHTLPEQWLPNGANSDAATRLSRVAMYERFVAWITESGITLDHVDAPVSRGGVIFNEYDESGNSAYLPEMSARNAVAQVVFLTECLSGADQWEFVDAGIPSVYWGRREGNVVPRIILEEDVADLTHIVNRNISQITNANQDYKFNMYLQKMPQRFAVKIPNTEFGAGIGTIDYDQIGSNPTGLYTEIWGSSGGASQRPLEDANLLRKSPHGIALKVLAGSSVSVELEHVTFDTGGGEDVYDNPNGRPGDVLSAEPFTIGTFSFGSRYVMFDVRNIFFRDTNMISFTFRGDPRWQPRDYLEMAMRDGTTLHAQILEISIQHEGGGTTSTVVARRTEGDLN